MTEKYNISNVNPVNFEFQDYQSSDDSLIPSFLIENINFDPSVNKIEVSFFNSDNSYIVSDYDLKSYSLLGSNITIDPENDIKSYGLGTNSGTYYILYNFIELLLNSSPTNTYYISEISNDRTELRLSSTNLSDEQIVEGANTFIQQYNVSSSYFPDFYLNFGDNDLVIANNILLQNNTVLIKLYEPLPEKFDLKSQLWVINKLANSIAYSVEVLISFDDEITIGVPIKGPNFNIPLKDQVNNTTDYINYNTLQTSLSSSLTNQLNNVLKNKSIRLNIDYTDYNNFIHFSSAETRLENFYYKLTLIEDYNQQALSASLSPINNYLSSSQNVYLNKIKEIEEGFDGYEYHLYYDSGSTSWPKSNSIQPYINYPSTSSQGQTWLNGQLDTASIYDSENKDALINAIPLFLKEDPQNAPYELFVEMVGQHFDVLYLYYEEVANKYNADNRIEYGISRDVVSDVLKDFGIKIYQNNFSTNDLYSSFLGITNNLNLLPPTGSELITNYITASNNIIPLENVNIGTYKRIYHNLPLLFKKKGTVEGIKLLINLYGIPDTILSVNEFGGKNKINANDWDQFQDQFNYEFFTTSSGFVSKAIPSGITSASLSTVEFRFKTTGIPVATTSSFSQSLASFSGSAYDIVIEYTGSGYATGSYSSSIANPEYQYGTLKLISGSISASVYLPIFDGNWWSVLTTCYAGTSSLYLKNKIYSGYDGNKIGFQASSSFTSSGFWINSVSASNFYLSYSSSKSIAGKTYTPFSGSFQELRFYSVAISESVFNDYVMNPYSIESNQLNGSQTSQATLIFRAPLGSELDKSGSARTSVHPGISYYPVTQSFSSGNSIYTFSGSYSFIPNTEVIYLDQFPAGIRNIISNKIKIESTFIPAGDTLSSLISLQQNYEASQSYTNDINYAEVAFSPQNEINKDIISQLGYFNIGDYIGDPRQLINKKTTEYADFNQLRDQYFAKYSSSYDLVDYVRLIKYFDNSLFKLIKDFVPARTSLSTGIIIKQHLLERNKYAPAQGSYEFEDYSGSVKSFPYNYEESPLYKLSVGPGGVMPEYENNTSASTVSHTSNTIATFGTMSFVARGGSYRWSTGNDIDIYYSGWSGSYHTNLSPVSHSVADNSNYQSFTITASSDIILSPSIPLDGYTLWLYLSGSGGGYNTWYSQSVDITTLTSSGYQIILTGNTNVNLPTDLATAGFTSSVDPNPFNNIVLWHSSSVDIIPSSTTFTYPGVINLTQSWIEPFVGPTGLSHISHIDRKEFFDGELQGTELIATDGNLNGDNIFLSLVQPESNYKVRFYSFNTGSWYESIPGNGEINILASNPSSSGEAYIKMSKTDIQGNYYGLSLSYLDSFKIQYPTRTVEYNVLSKADYSNYMVYSYYPVLNTYPLDLSGIILEYSASASYSAGSVSAYITNGYANGGSTLFSSKPIIADVVLYDALNYYTASYENPKVAVDITASTYTIKDWINVPLFIEAQMELTADNGVGGSSWQGRILLFKFSQYSPSGFGSQPIFQSTDLQLSNGVSLLAAGTVVGAASQISATATLTALDSTPKKGDSYFWAITNESDNSSITASNMYVNVKLANPSVFGLAQTGSSNLVFYSPYLPKPFEGGDYDSIYANIDKVEPSQYIESLDSNYLTNPLFFKYVISGSSEKAPVKDYYYTLEKHIRPRYKGSRSTTDNFNTSSVSQALQTQFSQSLWLNPKPNDVSIANGYFTTIYEFDNSSPILEFPGRIFKLNPNQIISTDNTSSAINTKPYINDNFLFTVQNQFDTTTKNYTITASSFSYGGFIFKLGTMPFNIGRPITNNVLLNQYTLNSNTPASNISLFPSNVLPSQSLYWIPSKFTNPSNVDMIGGNFAASPTYLTSSLLFTSGSIPTIIVQNDGTYITGSLVDFTNIATTIGQSILSGSRWFMSTFWNLPSIYSNKGFGRDSLGISDPTLNGTVARQYLDISNPTDVLLNSLGIYEIGSASISVETVNLNGGASSTSATVGILHAKGGSTFTNSKEFGSKSTSVWPITMGCIIWKATENAPVIAVDNNLSGLGKGNILPYYVSPFIKNNLNYIVENFGNKPKP